MSDKKVEAKTEKTPLPKRISDWFKGMRSELKKVVWPTRKQLINNTVIVIIAVVLVSATVGVLDYVFYRLLTLLRGAF